MPDRLDLYLHFQGLKKHGRVTRVMIGASNKDLQEINKKRADLNAKYRLAVLAAQQHGFQTDDLIHSYPEVQDAVKSFKAFTDDAILELEMKRLLKPEKRMKTNASDNQREAKKGVCVLPGINLPDVSKTVTRKHRIPPLTLEWCPTRLAYLVEDLRDELQKRQQSSSTAQADRLEEPKNLGGFFTMAGVSGPTPDLRGDAEPADILQEFRKLFARCIRVQLGNDADLNLTPDHSRELCALDPENVFPILIRDPRFQGRDELFMTFRHAVDPSYHLGFRANCLLDVARMCRER